DGGVGIGNFLFAVFDLDGLEAARFERLAAGVDSEGGADVAAFGRIDAPQVADAFAVFRILAHGLVDLAIVDGGGADQVIAGAAAAEDPLGLLGVAVELPEEFGIPLAVAGGIEAVQPAVAAGEE